MTGKSDPTHVEGFLQHPAGASGLTTVEVKTNVRVTQDQMDAFKKLPPDLQAKLGPPVYGQVMSANAIQDLAQSRAVSSTVMCPW